MQTSWLLSIIKEDQHAPRSRFVSPFETDDRADLHGHARASLLTKPAEPNSVANLEMVHLLFQAKLDQSLTLSRDAVARL